MCANDGDNKTAMKETKQNSETFAVFLKNHPAVLLEFKINPHKIPAIIETPD